MAPAYMIDTGSRPTKVDRASDVTGLVDTGKLVGLLSQQESFAILMNISCPGSWDLPAHMEPNTELRRDPAKQLAVELDLGAKLWCKRAMMQVSVLHSEPCRSSERTYLRNGGFKPRTDASAAWRAFAHLS